MYSNVLDGKPLIGLLIGVAISTTSCRNEPGSIFKDGHSEKPIVLVAGYSGTSGSNHTAKYWLNGHETALTNGNNDAYANSIFVSGSNVYIAGTDASPDTYGFPVYWKNNTQIKLPTKSTSGSANSICVSGGDIYVAGTDSSKGVYWKNGVETILDNTTDSGSTASAICISGSDVYVAGTRGYNAVYWKNGNIVYLTGYSAPTQHVRVNGIAVTNGKVYVVGYVNRAASPFPYLNYWADGVATDLNTGYDVSSPNNNFGQVCAVCNSGNDLFIAGMVETTNQMINNAVYWKNGVQTVLTGSAGNSFACSICSKEDDVFVAGYIYDTGLPKTAVYWKNGVESKLTDGTTETVATSIFVK